jgi:ribosomal protein S18 acetylase RimI-like enzyme
MHLRGMLPADLNFAARCTAAEGWLTETRLGFEGFMAHDPAGCFVAEVDGQPVGIGVATCYGQYGFVGELIVIEEMRGRGIGGRLLDHAVGYLRRRGVQNVLLDGVARAVPLYERAGFRKICHSLRFSGSVPGGTSPHVRRMQPADLEAVFALDRRAFGADRSFFLKRLLDLYPELCHVLERDGQVAGFIAGRRGSGLAVAIGPWVVLPEAGSPGDLLRSLAAQAAGSSLSLGVLETNVQAVETIRSFGLSERPQPPWRMALGPSADLGTSPLAYAIGSPAKG